MGHKRRLRSLSKKMNEDYRKKGRHILFSLVFLVLGFMLAFSYNTLGKNNKNDVYTSKTYIQEEKYREDLGQQKERNKELTDEIAAKQEEIQSYEQSFSTSEEDHAELVKEANDLRLLLGVVPAVGQ